MTSTTVAVFPFSQSAASLLRTANRLCDLQLPSAISNQRDAKWGVIFNCCSWQVDSCHSPACPRFFKLYVVIAAD